MSDEYRLVPHFQLVVDGSAADAALAGSVIGIRVTDDMDRASRFWVHLSDVDRKWTRSGRFSPGMAVEIKLGYVGRLRSVCKGEIATLEVVLTPDGPARLVLAGVDKGHAFDQGTVTMTYRQVKDSDLAVQIARRHGLSATVDDSKVVHDYVIQNNLSDFDFLMQRAEAAGFRVYVDDQKLLFKKARVGDAPAAKLVWRENIGRLVQEVNTYDQVSKIRTSGWDPATMKEQTASSKKGDEYGTQGGTMTGAQLVKQMYGDIEAVLPVASGQKNLLEAVAKSEFNRRAGTFVHAEGRVTGDPAIRAGCVVEVEKAGKRVDGHYYVVSTDHLFFVDTGYATEFRAKRYTIKKAAPPVKNAAKLASQAQSAAQQAQRIAQQVQQVAAWTLKAAREAAKAAQQAIDAAKQVCDQVEDALEQVKQGSGEVAQTALRQLEGRLAAVKEYVRKAEAKVGEAEQEASSASQQVAKEALTKAHEAAKQVTEIASQAIRHAQDAHDAVKAAALDAMHTSGDGHSPAVKGLKKGLLASAEATLQAGKAGMTLASAALTKGKSAIEMCAASATASAASLVEGLGGDLGNVSAAVKQSGDGATKSLGGAIAAGAQHALDSAKKAIQEVQDSIAKAKQAVEDAAKDLEKNVGDKLKDAVEQAKGVVDQAKKTADELKQKFDEYKKTVEDTIDQCGGKWIKAGLYLKEHGEKAYEAGKSLYDRCGKAVDLLRDRKWEEAEAQIEPAQKDFETAKSEAQLCIDKLQEIEKELPDSVKETLGGIVERLRQMLPQGESTLQKTIDAIRAKIGQLAQQAKELYGKAKQAWDAAEAEIGKYRKKLQEVLEFRDAVKGAIEHGENAWRAGKECVERCKAALANAEKNEWSAAATDLDAAKKSFDEAKQEAEACRDDVDEAADKLPEKVREPLKSFLEKVRTLLAEGDSTLQATKQTVEQKGDPAAAKVQQSGAEKRFGEGLSQSKQLLDGSVEEAKKTVSEAVDRLLEKARGGVLEAARKSIESSLQTANHAWDLKEGESASAAEATQGLEEALKKAFAQCEEEQRALAAHDARAGELARELLGHLSGASSSSGELAAKAAGAAGEVRENPVRKAGEQQAAGSAEHRRLSGEHDARKDKHEEQTKAFLGALKQQYGKLHEAGLGMHGPLGETIERSGIAIDKSSRILMSQARGAADQLKASQDAAEKSYVDAGKLRAALGDRADRIPGLRAHLDGAFESLRTARGEGDKALAKARETVSAHEKEIEVEAEKLTQEAAEAAKRAEAALAKAKQQLERNRSLSRALPQRPGTADQAEAAGAAVQSATGAGESAIGSGKQARGAALGACKVPDDEKVKQGALESIAECDKAAKKAGETAEAAQKAVDSARDGDAAAAKKSAGEAAASQQATASASASADAAAERSQQSAAQAAGKKEEPKQEAPKEAAKQEAPKEAAKPETTKEAAKQEAPKEAAKQEAPKEAAKPEASKEAAKQEAPKEAAKREAPKEAAKQESPREAAKQDAAAKEEPKPEAAAAPVAAAPAAGAPTLDAAAASADAAKPGAPSGPGEPKEGILDRAAAATDQKPSAGGAAAGTSIAGTAAAVASSTQDTAADPSLAAARESAQAAKSSAPGVAGVAQAAAEAKDTAAAAAEEEPAVSAGTADPHVAAATTSATKTADAVRDAKSAVEEAAGKTGGGSGGTGS